MDFLDLLQMRRSVRSFDGSAVSREELNALLDAGVRAPNACNAQSWHFFCTLDRERIRGAIPQIAAQPFIGDAGCLILICTDPEILEKRAGAKARALYAIQDTAAAATQILQCATTLGLGGCWIGSFIPESTKQFFSVPENMDPVILLAIGHPTELPPLRERKSMADVVTVLEDTIQ